jgi:hypothetical protein
LAPSSAGGQGRRASGKTVLTFVQTFLFFPLAKPVASNDTIYPESRMIFTEDYEKQVFIRVFRQRLRG